MSDPFIGEIRMFGGNFPPAGWAFCEGQTLAIAENDALFALIGTTYGGDGQVTFNLPDLRGRVPIHQGQGPGLSQNYVLGEQAGVESVTLSQNQIPSHSHPAMAATVGNTTSPVGAIWAGVTSGAVYRANASADVAMKSVQPTGGNQPHENLMPSLCVSFIISLFGIFPSST